MARTQGVLFQLDFKQHWPHHDQSLDGRDREITSGRFHAWSDEETRITTWKRSAANRFLHWQRGELCSRLYVHDFTQARNISLATTTKQRLLDLVAPLKDHFVKFKVYIAAEKAGYIVLRLPAHHCEFNPIGLIWAQMKSEHAGLKTDFSIASMQKHLATAAENVSPDNSVKALQPFSGIDDRRRELHFFSERAEFNNYFNAIGILPIPR